MWLRKVKSLTVQQAQGQQPTAASTSSLITATSSPGPDRTACRPGPPAAQQHIVEQAIQTCTDGERTTLLTGRPSRAVQAHLQHGSEPGREPHSQAGKGGRGGWLAVNTVMQRPAHTRLQGAANVSACCNQTTCTPLGLPQASRGHTNSLMGA
jgi:hypothetical protein